jgi:protein SCO1/2
MSRKKSIVLYCIIVSLFIVILWYTFGKFSKSPNVKTRSCTRFPTPLEITNFNLNEVHHNKNFNKQSLKGHWNLVFFGYTNCPDICPNTMEIIKDVWNNLEKHYIPARFIFITLDPDKDTNKEIRKFLLKYNENFIGLNGEKDQIILLKKSLGIYAKSTIKNGIDIINHAGILLLINPKGQLYGIFSPPLISKNIKNDLVNIIYN